MIDFQEKKFLVEIAKEYYEHRKTQAEIANRFNISRPMVSRKLAEAREIGIVKIFVDSSSDTMSLLEQKLFSRFNLKGLRIASVPNNDIPLSVQLTAKAGAQYLRKFIKPGDKIGVGWGWTLYEMSSYLSQLPIGISLVCQITGSVDNAMTKGYANEIVNNFYQKLSSREAYCLPCPVMVSNAYIADTLILEPKINNVLSLGKKCNKLFVNIANPDRKSCLYQAGYINDSDLGNLHHRRAAGSICCRFFDQNGNICDEELDNRTVGISLNEIKNAECVLACITGQEKAEAIYYALKADFIDVLVIDSVTAEAILAIDEANT